MTNRINITEFGAKNNGITQTKPIQNAIDACHQNGGGEVLIPAGEFLTGSLSLRSNVTLHLMDGAVLLGSSDYEDYRMDTVGDSEPIWQLARRPVEYRHTRWYNAMISAFDCENVGIIGPGALLDGDDCYDAQGEEGFRGPHLTFFCGCSNIHLEGYTTNRSANYAHLLEDCENVHINGVTVLSGHDAIHIQRCKDIVISGCTLHTGDDCIAGSDNENIKISHCDLNSSCNGFRIGCYNLFVEHCRLYGPGEYEHKVSNRHNMLSAFSYFSPVARLTELTAGKWIIQDCYIDSVDYLFTYDFSGKHQWQNAQPLYNIRLENITATNLRYPINICGDRAKLFSMEIHNANLSFAEGCEAQPILSVCRFKHITLKNITVENNTSLPLIETSSPDKIEIINLNNRCEGPLIRQIDVDEWSLPRF